MPDGFPVSANRNPPRNPTFFSLSFLFVLSLLGQIFDCDGRTGKKKHDSDTQTTQDVEAQRESGGRIPG